MAKAPTQQRRALSPLNHGRVQRSMVAEARAERLRVNGVYKIDDALATLGNFAANTPCYIDFPVGKYTYRQWGISLIATAAIGSVTDLKDGQNWVKSAKIADYVDTFTIEIDGRAVWELTAAELLKWNDYQNIATSEGVLRIPFGAPGQHNDDMAEDAYHLGTASFRQVRLKIKTKAAWVAGMLPVITCEYLDVARPAGYFVTTTRYTYTSGGAGKFAITDLAVGKDFSTIWVQGANVQRAKLTVDDDTVFDNYVTTLNAVHEAFGRDVTALGAGFVYDSFRDGDAIGLDSISDSIAERKRGADVRLEMQIGAASQTLGIVVFHCGLYAQQ